MNVTTSKTYFARKINVAGRINQINQKARKFLLLTIDGIDFHLVLTFDESKISCLQLEKKRNCAETFPRLHSFSSDIKHVKDQPKVMKKIL